MYDLWYFGCRFKFLKSPWISIIPRYCWKVWWLRQSWTHFFRNVLLPCKIFVDKSARSCQQVSRFIGTHGSEVVSWSSAIELECSTYGYFKHLPAITILVCIAPFLELDWYRFENTPCKNSTFPSAIFIVLCTLNNLFSLGICKSYFWLWNIECLLWWISFDIDEQCSCGI